VLALGVLALLLKALPGSQGNLEILALVLPVHAALAWGAWRLARLPAVEPTPAPPPRSAGSKRARTPAHGSR
jgi:hypothetical protein